MDLLSGIESRISAAKLGEPAPAREHLERILHAGCKAPDHGRLRPWRFVVIEGTAREKLGAAMAELLRAKYPDTNEAQLAAERGKALRAPTVIAVAAKITKGKIPEIEQVLSAGAAAQNMLLAAHALGYGGMWKTGAAAYDANVKALLGLAPEDHVVALLYLGTTVIPGVPAPVSTDGLVSRL
jgi:nitroreductase